jgi:hypothetical protein
MRHSAESIFVVEYLREYESICKTVNQGTQGYSLTKKTEGRKSRDTLPLINWVIFQNTCSIIYCFKSIFNLCYLLKSMRQCEIGCKSHR